MIKVTTLAFSIILSAPIVAFAQATTTETEAAVEIVTYEILGDAKKGAKVFKKCKACHEVGGSAKNKVGPVLNGLLGRAAGAFDGFKFSAAMMTKTEDGLVWTPETLDAFLIKPKAYVPGTKMSFAGLKKDSQRLDIRLLDVSSGLGDV